MTYKVVFDSTSSESGWLLWYAPILFVSLVMLVVVLRMIWNNWHGARRIALMGIGIALLLGLQLSYRYVYYHQRYTKFWHHNAAYQTVEGKVTNLRAFAGKELKFESFHVAGSSFSYADVGPPRCFHKPVVNGGPIHEGLAVRVSFDEGCIVKLEVATDPQ